MPLYEYACDACGRSEERLRRVAERDEPLACPACGAAAHPVLSAAAVHAGGGPATPPHAAGPSCCGGGCGMN